MKTRILALASVIALSATAMGQQRINTTYVDGTPGGKGEGPQMVTDGMLYTKWCLDNPQRMPYFVVLDAGKAEKVSEYGLVTGDDTFYYPGRNPLKWKLCGSNDKKAWTLLDEVKFDRQMSDENEKEYRYKVKDAQPYRYYRLEVSETRDATRLQLSEVMLYR